MRGVSDYIFVRSSGLRFEDPSDSHPRLLGNDHRATVDLTYALDSPSLLTLPLIAFLKGYPASVETASSVRLPAPTELDHRLSAYRNVTAETKCRICYPWDTLYVLLVELRQARWPTRV